MALPQDAIWCPTKESRHGQSDEGSEARPATALSYGTGDGLRRLDNEPGGAIRTTVAWRSAAKPAPSTTAIPGAVTFSDRLGDAITSDGLGTYVDGGRLEVSFYTASRDLVMRGGSRTLNLNHETRISGTGAIGTTQVSDIFMNIHHILDMARGETRVVAATFKRVNTEFFHFNQAYDSSATKVTVVRDDDGAWTVTASDPDTDLTALIKKGTAIGLYAMPFQLTAVCPTCS